MQKEETNFRHSSTVLPEGTEADNEESPDRDANRASSEEKSETLLLEQTCLIDKVECKVVPVLN
jgi:hypothetical protein